MISAQKLDFISALPEYWNDEDKTNYELLVADSKRYFPYMDEYVIHLEDDWFLVGKKNWLTTCIKFMDDNKDVSTIALRKYGSEKEKYDYGWTRTIPYVCHEHKDNFDYQNKLGVKKVVMHNNDLQVFTEIKHFLLMKLYDPISI